jgi:hypothetical protein
MSTTTKNNLNLATVVSMLMGDIFDISQNVYDTLETFWRGWESQTYDYGTSRYVGPGDAARDFRDKLNYAAMVTDYGLAEIFSALLAATVTTQSASVNLSARGDVSISGQVISAVAVGENKAVATPTLAVQEGIYTAKVALAVGEFSKIAIGIIYGSKARADAAKEEPKLEAL